MRASRSTSTSSEVGTRDSGMSWNATAASASIMLVARSARGWAERFLGPRVTTPLCPSRSGCGNPPGKPDLTVEKQAESVEDRLVVLAHGRDVAAGTVDRA